MGKNAFALGADLLCPDRMGNLGAEHLDFAAVGLPQQGGDLFGEVGPAVHHRQQDTVNLELGIDLPLDLIDCLEQLLSTINKVKRQLNPKLQIDGILLTMVDNRTNFAKEIAALLRETYGSKIKVFCTEIPHSVRAKETSAEGKSIFAHDPGGKVAEGYRNLTKEVLKLEKQREKSRAGIGR